MIMMMIMIIYITKQRKRIFSHHIKFKKNITSLSFIVCYTKMECKQHTHIVSIMMEISCILLTNEFFLTIFEKIRVRITQCRYVCLSLFLFFYPLFIGIYTL